MKGQIIGTLTGGVLVVASGLVLGAKVGLACGGPGGAMAGTIPFGIIGGVIGILGGNNVGFRFDNR